MWDVNETYELGDVVFLDGIYWEWTGTANTTGQRPGDDPSWELAQAALLINGPIMDAAGASLTNSLFVNSPAIGVSEDIVPANADPKNILNFRDQGNFGNELGVTWELDTNGNISGTTSLPNIRVVDTETYETQNSGTQDQALAEFVQDYVTSTAMFAAWDFATNYVVGDYVEFEGTYYVALRNDQGFPPGLAIDANNPHWEDIHLWHRGDLLILGYNQSISRTEMLGVIAVDGETTEFDRTAPGGILAASPITFYVAGNELTNSTITPTGSNFNVVYQAGDTVFEEGDAITADFSYTESGSNAASPATVPAPTGAVLNITLDFDPIIPQTISVEAAGVVSTVAAVAGQRTYAVTSAATPK